MIMLAARWFGPKAYACASDLGPLPDSNCRSGESASCGLSNNLENAALRANGGFFALADRSRLICLANSKKDLNS
jgi:hypothetical protein